MKNPIFSVINFVLFLIFFRLSIPIWFLFLLLSVFYLYRSVCKRPSASSTYSDDKSSALEYGVLDYWSVDGDERDKNFGAYIHLMGLPVFIDIREDEFLEERKTFAKKLIENREVLESGLKKFIENNPAYSDSQINSIGIHSKSLDQGEVFWDPSGYTILKEFEFRSPGP